MQEYIEPPEFRGLLFFDGLDSLGRPVVIVNADAMGENKGARKNAFQHIVQVLEPIVVQVQSPSGHEKYPDALSFGCSIPATCLPPPPAEM